MSKELESLENLCNQCEFYQFEKGLIPKKCPFDKNCVHKHRIGKALKALEIIKQNIIKITPFEDYGCTCIYIAKPTKEEYELLEEVLL